MVAVLDKVAKSSKEAVVRQVTGVIKAPDIRSVVFNIKGTAPYVQARRDVDWRGKARRGATWIGEARQAR